MTLNSASMLDLDTIFYFLVAHDTILSPKKLQNLVVDFIYGESDAQSASH